MSSQRRRRRFWVLCCLAFFGAYMAYATIMLLANAEADHSRVEGCGQCHNPAPAQAGTWQAWGGFSHAPVSSGGGAFPGVPNSFRM